MNLDEHLASGPSKNPRPCIIGRWIAQQRPETQEKLHAALVGDEWPTLQLHRVLIGAGLNASLSSLRSHRLDECGCSA